jgi:hypothetical protein
LYAWSRLRALVLTTLLATAATTVTPTPASADEPQQPKNPGELPQRQANFAWDKTLLRASFSFRDLIDTKLAEKLSRGPANTIAMRAYVVREGETTPIALAVRTCQVSFDIWDEVYRVTIRGADGERNVAAVNLEGVLRQCAEARDYPIADKSVLTAGKPTFLAVIAEVNPISPEMLEQMRHWVSRPAGSTGIGAGDALFGSFVGLFLRQIGTSDKTLKFKTQTFTP